MSPLDPNSDGPCGFIHAMARRIHLRKLLLLVALSIGAMGELWAATAAPAALQATLSAQDLQDPASALWLLIIAALLALGYGYHRHVVQQLRKADHDGPGSSPAEAAVTPTVATAIPTEEAPTDDACEATAARLARYEAEIDTLRDAKERAEESARLKSSILNNMSHEIRTPLTAILGYAQILGMEVGADHQEFVDFIEQNGKRLMSTLNSILDLSRLESNNVEIERMPVNLTDAAQAVVSLMKPLAQQRCLTLRAKVAADELVAVADRGAVDRVLNNLVSNALKFTREGEVVIQVRPKGEGIEIQVSDTGIGISSAFLPKLFDAFKQESRGVGEAHGGSGLGLAITKHLVQLMHGQIDVTSERHVGTTFTVWLPAPPPPEGSKDTYAPDRTQAKSLRGPEPSARRTSVSKTDAPDIP